MLRGGVVTEQLPAAEFDLDETLAKFEVVDSGAAAMAKFRVFGGLSVEEAGDRVSALDAWLTSRLARTD